MKLRVYVAGPITKGVRFDNIQRAIMTGRELVEEGFTPFVPHLDAFMFPDPNEISLQEFMELDLPWVRVSDAVLRLPGESAGADREVAFATDWDIPVFNRMSELLAWRQDRIDKYSRKGCATCRGI